MKKKELVESLKQILDINWDKLSVDDLRKAYQFFDDPRNLINLLIDALGTEEFIKTVNECFAVRLVREKPLRRLVKGLLFGGEKK